MGGRSVAERILLALEREGAEGSKQTDLRRDVLELNVLRAFGAAVNERPDKEGMIAAVGEHLSKLFDFTALLLLVDFEHPEMHAEARPGAPDELVSTMAAEVIGAYGRLRGMVYAVSTIPIHKTTRGERVAVGKATRAASQLVLPLVSGGETIGCLALASHRARAYGPLDVQLFSLVTYQLGASLRNALLLERVRQEAIRDPLTRLFNRRHFTERLEEDLRRARRYRHPVSLIVGDVDHFKEINDELGHPAGDEVLKAVAEALAEGARRSDVLCRYGGEEFAAILPQATVEEGVLVAERFRRLVASRTAKVTGVKRGVTMSFGVASIGSDDPPTKLETLIARADSALYLAKRGGRDRVCASLADGSLQEQTSLSDLEQRRFPRIRTELPLRFLVVPDLGQIAEKARAIDVSPSGLRLEVDRELPPGAFVLLSIGDKKKPLQVVSQIVWTRAEGGRTTVGTKILAADGPTDHLAELVPGRRKGGGGRRRSKAPRRRR